MNLKTLARLKEWFAGYCATFYSSDTDYQRNIRLKEEHTANVCADMRRLAGAEGLTGDDLAIAEAVALFHDVGRFEQYRKFRTFRDSDSVNHAILGVQVLTETGVLGSLPVTERRIIQQAVCFHNAFEVPVSGVDAAAWPFVLLIRDADKLDIWRLFIELFDLPPEERASAAVLGLPDTGRYSQDVLRTLQEGSMIHLTQLHTVDDFKLLQLSWIYDINFPASLRLVRERDYIRRVASTMPRDHDIQQAVSFLEDYVDRRSLEEPRVVMDRNEGGKSRP